MSNFVRPVFRKGTVCLILHGRTSGRRGRLIIQGDTVYLICLASPKEEGESNLFVGVGGGRLA